MENAFGRSVLRSCSEPSFTGGGERVLRKKGGLRSLHSFRNPGPGYFNPDRDGCFSSGEKSEVAELANRQLSLFGFAVARYLSRPDSAGVSVLSQSMPCLYIAASSLRISDYKKMGDLIVSGAASEGSASEHVLCFEEGDCFYGALRFTVRNEKRILLHDGLSWMLVTGAMCGALKHYAEERFVPLDSLLDYAIVHSDECFGVSLQCVASYPLSKGAAIFVAGNTEDKGFIVCSDERVRDAAEEIFSCR